MLVYLIGGVRELDFPHLAPEVHVLYHHHGTKGALNVMYPCPVVQPVTHHASLSTLSRDKIEDKGSNFRTWPPVDLRISPETASEASYRSGLTTPSYSHRWSGHSSTHPHLL